MILKTIVPKGNLYSRFLRFWRGWGYEDKTLNAVNFIFKIKYFLTREGYESLISITHDDKNYNIELNILPRVEVKTREVENGKNRATGEEDSGSRK